MTDQQTDASGELEYVGFWLRVGAALIDTLILLVIILPVLFSVYGEDYLFSDRFIQGPLDFLVSWVLPAVAVIYLWARFESTPGKMAIGARVVDAQTGQRASVAKYALRYLGYYVSIIPFGLGLIWVAFDSRKRGWHDMIAGTVVIRKRDRSPEPVRFDNSDL